MTESELGAWAALLLEDARPLLDELAEGDPTPKRLLVLRERWPRAVIDRGIELTRARARAIAKFPDRPDLMADVSGIEQATSQRVADHKAKRFRALSPSRLLDLCSGIGGDAMSLAPLAATVAFDSSPVRAWMTRENAGCPAVAQDVTTLHELNTAFHLDPARRTEESGGRRDRRHHDLDSLQPGLDFVQAWLGRNPTGAIKLGPGSDLDRVQRELSGELELVSEQGRLVQAVLWTGELASGNRRATLLPEGLTFEGTPGSPEVNEDTIHRYLLEPDPAVERARLLPILGAPELAPGLGLLTGEDLVPGTTAFEVLERMPWRWKKVEAALTALQVGSLEVKTRGKAVDPERVRRDWAGTGNETATLFVLRLGEKKIAVITRRV